MKSPEHHVSSGVHQRRRTVGQSNQECKETSGWKKDKHLENQKIHFDIFDL